MDIERKEISRKQLYDEIWELSLAGVARKYNLNYSRFRSLCKDEDIPVPSSGYWTRKNMGKDVSGEKPELTGPPDKVLFLSLNKEIKIPDKKGTLPEEPIAATDNSEAERSVVIWDESRLDFLDTEERDKVLASASELRITETQKTNGTITTSENDCLC